MSISPISEIVAELSAGRMVILVDEEDRENEGDLVLASDFVTPEAINFMVTHARGLVCLTLTEARCKQLGLKQMARDNGSQFSTAFTNSIEPQKASRLGFQHTIAHEPFRLQSPKTQRPTTSYNLDMCFRSWRAMAAYSFAPATLRQVATSQKWQV